MFKCFILYTVLLSQVALSGSLLSKKDPTEEHLTSLKIQHLTQDIYLRLSNFCNDDSILHIFEYLNIEDSLSSEDFLNSFSPKNKNLHYVNWLNQYSQIKKHNYRVLEEKYSAYYQDTLVAFPHRELNIFDKDDLSKIQKRIISIFQHEEKEEWFSFQDDFLKEFLNRKSYLKNHQTEVQGLVHFFLISNVFLHAWEEADLHVKKHMENLYPQHHRLYLVFPWYQIIPRFITPEFRKITIYLWLSLKHSVRESFKDQGPIIKKMLNTHCSHRHLSHAEYVNNRKRNVEYIFSFLQLHFMTNPVMIAKTLQEKSDIQPLLQHSLVSLNIEDIFFNESQSGLHYSQVNIMSLYPGVFSKTNF